MLKHEKALKVHSRSSTVSGIWEPFKNNEKCFSFHLKNSLCSQDIWIFVSIRKIRLILKFITSQSGKKIIATYILPNFSKSKGNQTMKFGQLIKYDTRNTFLEKSFTKPFLDSHCMRSVQIRIFFWSIFSRIRIEYRGILRISLYSVRMQENTDQKKLRIWTHFTECF